jgi:hypothetical protein
LNASLVGLCRLAAAKAIKAKAAIQPTSTGQRCR